MSDDQFSQLFKRLDNVDERFGKCRETNKRFDAQDNKIDDLSGAVAELSTHVYSNHMAAYFTLRTL